MDRDRVLAVFWHPENGRYHVHFDDRVEFWSKDIRKLGESGIIEKGLVDG